MDLLTIRRWAEITRNAGQDQARENKLPKDLLSHEAKHSAATTKPCPDLRWAKSPIASVQRMRSTLAGHAAVPRGTNGTRMRNNRAI